MPQPGMECKLKPIRERTPSNVLWFPITFPVILGDIEIPEEFKHAEYETAFDGDFSVPGGGDASARPLRPFDFETLVLSYEQPWTFADYDTPDDFIDGLLEIGRSKKPVQLTINNGELDIINRMITLRNVTQRYPHGQPEAVYLQIQTKEFRPGEVERLGTSSASRNPNKPTLPAKHKLKAGESLRFLSKLYYGSYAEWRLIAERNNVKNWGGDTPLNEYAAYKSSPGAVLVIPKKPVGRGGNGAISIVRPR